MAVTEISALHKNHIMFHIIIVICKQMICRCWIYYYYMQANKEWTLFRAWTSQISSHIFPQDFPSRQNISPGRCPGVAWEGPGRGPYHACALPVNGIFLLRGFHFYWCSWQAGVAQECPGMAWEWPGRQAGSPQAGHRCILGPSSHISPKFT